MHAHVSSSSLSRDLFASDSGDETGGEDQGTSAGRRPSHGERGGGGGGLCDSDLLSSRHDDRQDKHVQQQAAKEDNQRSTGGSGIAAEDNDAGAIQGGMRGGRGESGLATLPPVDLKDLDINDVLQVVLDALDLHRHDSHAQVSPNSALNRISAPGVRAGSQEGTQGAGAGDSAREQQGSSSEPRGSTSGGAPAAADATLLWSARGDMSLTSKSARKSVRRELLLAPQTQTEEPQDTRNGARDAHAAQGGAAGDAGKKSQGGGGEGSFLGGPRQPRPQLHDSCDRREDTESQGVSEQAAALCRIDTILDRLLQTSSDLDVCLHNGRQVLRA